MSDSYQTMDYQYVTTTPAERNRVLRNTYWLLALSMVPTVLGAWLGVVTGLSRAMSGGVGLVVFLVGAFGFIYAIQKTKDSSKGVPVLLAFTFFMGIMLSRMIAMVLGFKNGAELIMTAFGGTAGVVSLRDAVGEISGEVSSEWTNEPGVTLDAQGWWRMPGDIDLALAAERMQVLMPESESATLGGFFMEHLNRVPQANDSLVVDGLEMIVESMERNRVLWVKVRVSANNNQRGANE